MSNLARASASSPAGTTGERVGPGSSSGSRAGRPIPNPGIAALPQASSGGSSVPGRPRRGEVGRDLGVLETRQRVARAVHPVRPERVGAGARTGAPSRRRSPCRRSRAAPPRTRAARSPMPRAHRRPSPGPRPGAAGRTVSSAAIAASRSRGASPSGATAAPNAPPVRSWSPAGRSPMNPLWALNRLGAPIRAPAGKTRIAPPSASRTRKPMARSSLNRSRSSSPPVRTRARYQTHGHALERRDEGDLGRLDPAGDPHLARGEARDRGRRGVGDRRGGPVAAEAAPQQDEAGERCRRCTGAAGRWGSPWGAGRWGCRQSDRVRRRAPAIRAPPTTMIGDRPQHRPVDADVLVDQEPDPEPDEDDAQHEPRVARPRGAGRLGCARSTSPPGWCPIRGRATPRRTVSRPTAGRRRAEASMPGPAATSRRAPRRAASRAPRRVRAGRRAAGASSRAGAAAPRSSSRCTRSRTGRPRRRRAAPRPPGRATGRGSATRRGRPRRPRWPGRSGAGRGAQSQPSSGLSVKLPRFTDRLERDRAGALRRSRASSTSRRPRTRPRSSRLFAPSGEPPTSTRSGVPGGTHSSIDAHVHRHAAADRVRRRRERHRQRTRVDRRREAVDRRGRARGRRTRRRR